MIPMPREAPSPTKAYDAFVKALNKTTELIDKADLRGYELRHKNYRKIYLRRSNGLLDSLVTLRNSLGRSEPGNLVQTIMGRLKPVFDVNTDTKEKKIACDSLRFLLERLDQKIDRNSLQDQILLENRPYDAYKQILARIGQARRRVMISDPYVDDTIFPLYLDKVPPNVSIQVLTDNMASSFKIVASKFCRQRGKFEVRQFRHFHDRHLMVDGRIWIVGQSINRVGYKPLSIVEIRDVPEVEKMLENLWSRSQKVV